MIKLGMPYICKVCGYEGAIEWVAGDNIPEEVECSNCKLIEQRDYKIDFILEDKPFIPQKKFYTYEYKPQ